MSAKSKEPINPTFQGYISTSKDALIIIQAALTNKLQLVKRRPKEKERTSLIKSGNIFVFIEETSGIRRWTDSVAWSPSRILGRFLIYRELDKDALFSRSQLGKNGANARDDTGYGNKTSQSPLNDSLYDPMRDQMLKGRVGTSTSIPSKANSMPTSRSEMERSIVGSLVGSYSFKKNGLVKKSLSLTINSPEDQNRPKKTIHLVSYYSSSDVLENKLCKPSELPAFKDIKLPFELLHGLRNSSIGNTAAGKQQQSSIEGLYGSDSIGSDKDTVNAGWLDLDGFDGEEDQELLQQYHDIEASMKKKVQSQQLQYHQQQGMSMKVPYNYSMSSGFPVSSDPNAIPSVPSLTSYGNSKGSQYVPVPPVKRPVSGISYSNPISQSQNQNKSYNSYIMPNSVGNTVTDPVRRVNAQQPYYSTTNQPQHSPQDLQPATFASTSAYTSKDNRNSVMDQYNMTSNPLGTAANKGYQNDILYPKRIKSEKPQSYSPSYSIMNDTSVNSGVSYYQPSQIIQPQLPQVGLQDSHQFQQSQLQQMPPQESQQQLQSGQQNFLLYPQPVNSSSGSMGIGGIGTTSSNIGATGSMQQNFGSQAMQQGLVNHPQPYQSYLSFNNPTYGGSNYVPTNYMSNSGQNSSK
ncbi:hypothetical protein B5S31_g270 [[Candida] boidinii]|uniref:Unnamed protein product n=1 Tax=Candida boidinii TaxID=5477 RepID=A0ACB5TFX7_CANBO|nr:hypothetical protein B5S31_g270 [[Candida] boidinii]GME87643.1 unnamed protein product [[Candida] boidinii]